jgi:hypothetical protein
MRELIAGGGLIDLATLHPLGALIIIVAAGLALRVALRGRGPQRRGRSRRPHQAVQGR